MVDKDYITVAGPGYFFVYEMPKKSELNKMKILKYKPVVGNNDIKKNIEKKLNEETEKW